MMHAPMLSPFVPLARLQNEMNRLFEGFSEEMPALRPYSAVYPAINLWEDGENGYIEAELPGLTLNDIEVLVMGNELTIRGERKMPTDQDAAYHRRERAQGRFARTVTLPWEIDANKVEAKFQDGVLAIRLPKAESARPRKVKVLTA